jgi:hypothetical protein
MTDADRQLIEWIQARGTWLGATSLAVGYLLAKARDPERQWSPKLVRECEAILAGLRAHRAHELGLAVAK